MDFNLSDKQVELQNAVRDLFSHRFTTDNMRDAEQSADGFARDMWEASVGLGLSGMIIADEFGGRGTALLDACVLLEEVGRVGATLPLVAGAGLSAAILQAAPAGTHRDRCLSDIAAGKIMAPALIDAEARNEWDSVQLPLTDDGDEVVLSGKKIMVPFATSADELLVSAVSPTGDTTICVVDPSAGGVTLTPHHSGTGVPVASVEFDAVRVAKDRVIVQGQDALAALHKGLHIGSLLATAEAVGLSEAIKAITTQYVAKREAFGQPIGAFQAVAHPCADMHINAETIRLLTYQAAWMVDNDKDATEEIASTKALANELFERAANDAFCVHGAEGFAEACDLQLFMRRIRSFCQTMGETHESLERAAQSIGL